MSAVTPFLVAEGHPPPQPWPPSLSQPNQTVPKFWLMYCSLCLLLRGPRQGQSLAPSENCGLEASQTPPWTWRRKQMSQHLTREGSGSIQTFSGSIQTPPGSLTHLLPKR